jgi:hypothetical protein
LPLGFTGLMVGVMQRTNPLENNMAEGSDKQFSELGLTPGVEGRVIKEMSSVRI